MERYDLVCSEALNELGEAIAVYGVKCENMRFDDITHDKASAEEFVSVLNELELELCQFGDVVCDFVSGAGAPMLFVRN